MSILNGEFVLTTTGVSDTAKSATGGSTGGAPATGGDPNHLGL
jgi:hypothetical protein